MSERNPKFRIKSPTELKCQWGDFKDRSGNGLLAAFTFALRRAWNALNIHLQQIKGNTLEVIRQ